MAVPSPLIELPLFPLACVLFPGGQLQLRIFEPRYLDLVRECTRSIVDRQNFGRFHYHEVRCLAKSFERKHLSEKSLIELFVSDDIREAFERFIIKAGAHATACVQ